MTIVKKHGEISSTEVRDAIQRLMNDSVLGTLFGQHVIWQGMSDATKVKEPEEYFAAARKSASWIRTKKEKTNVTHGPTRNRITAWHRVYECKGLKGLEPKFSIDMLTSEDELTVYKVSMVYWMPRSNDPVRKEISVKEAFPNRDEYGSLPLGKLCIVRTLRALLWEAKKTAKKTAIEVISFTAKELVKIGMKKYEHAGPDKLQ